MGDPDYTVTLEDVRNWERRHGPVPNGSLAASDRLVEAVARRGCDGEPRWSRDVLTYLYEERGITASGHETTDTDPGRAVSQDDYSLKTCVLTLDHYQIELLANLDKVPEGEALMVIAFPKPEGDSGFPARAFAILP